VFAALYATECFLNLGSEVEIMMDMRFTWQSTGGPPVDSSRRAETQRQIIREFKEEKIRPCHPEKTVSVHIFPDELNVGFKADVFCGCGRPWVFFSGQLGEPWTRTLFQRAGEPAKLD
jgi:hypothetical protein